MLLRGRSEQLAVALAALTAAQLHGEGSVLLVTGEPGIGKTVFVRAILEQAGRRGFGTGYAAADEASQLVPGATLLLALRSGPHPLVDRVNYAKLAEPSLQPLWLAEDVADLLDRRAQRSPLVIALDDVQWADPLSRFLLRVLPGRLAGSPVVWVLAARPDPVQTPNSLIRPGSFEGLRSHTVELGPLSDQELIDLATDVLEGAPSQQLSSWLGQLDGNPFLAVELAEGVRRAHAAGRDGRELPPSFSARLRDRLQGLRPPTIRLLQLTAVWGGPMPIADAHQLAGGPVLVSELVATSNAGGPDPTVERIAGLPPRPDAGIRVPRDSRRNGDGCTGSSRTICWTADIDPSRRRTTLRSGPVLATGARSTSCVGQRWIRWPSSRRLQHC